MLLEKVPMRCVVCVSPEWSVLLAKSQDPRTWRVERSSGRGSILRRVVLRFDIENLQNRERS